MNGRRLAEITTLTRGTVVPSSPEGRGEGGDWLERLAEWDRRQGRSKNTVEAHRRDLGAFCDWYAQATGCEFTPGELNSFDLRRFRQWQLEVVKCSPATWNRRLASLRVLANWARMAGMDMPVDLFDGVLAQEAQQRAPDWLNAGEFDRLARYLESTAFDPDDDRTELRRRRAMRNRALAAVMVYAGLREQECADLMVGDVDLSERKGRIVVRSGKGGKFRVVPVADAGLRRILKRWVDGRGEAPREAHLLPNDEGGRLSERAIQDCVGELGSRCRVDDLRPHRLRHTFGKRMADAGVAIQVIADLMGHSSLEVTRRYVQPGEDDLREAVSLVAGGKMAKQRRKDA